MAVKIKLSYLKNIRSMGCSEKFYLVWFLMPKYTEKYINLFGQETTAPRYQAKSKRSKQQCRKAAIRGKQVCRIHGGSSTGPRTEQGRKRCAAAKTVHSWETRSKCTSSWERSVFHHPSNYFIPNPLQQEIYNASTCLRNLRHTLKNISIHIHKKIWS